MQLTQAQKTALKVHAAANTNTTPATAADGTALVTPFVVNTKFGDGNPDTERAIAEWYNLAALAGDNQPFANRRAWNPNTTLAQILAAWDPTADPVGADQPTITNGWLRWQSMTWAATQLSAAALDMTDAQTRAGVLKVWGDTGTSNANKIGALGCGQRIGTNFELVGSGVAVGGSAGAAFVAGHIVQKDAKGSLLYGQTLTQDQYHDAILNG